MSIVVVIRLQRGDFCFFELDCSQDDDGLLVKLLAAKKALLFAAELDLQNVILEGVEVYKGPFLV